MRDRCIRYRCYGVSCCVVAQNVARGDDDAADVPVSDCALICCRQVRVARWCREELVKSSDGWEMDVFDTGAMVKLAVLLHKVWREVMTIGLVCQYQIRGRVWCAVESW